MNMKESVLHQVAARYIVGEDIELKLDGTEKQLNCFKSLLEVSKELKKELDEGIDLKKCTILMEEKKELTRKFQDLTGITWQL